MQYGNILKKLKALSNPKAVEGMARQGIAGQKVFGLTAGDKTGGG